MEGDNETDPSKTKSLLNGSLEILDLNKKRKLEGSQLGLPVSKHQCWKQIILSKPPTFVRIVEVDQPLRECTSEGKGVDLYGASETGSGKDSNSFPGNSDSTISLHAEPTDVELDENAGESLVEYGSYIDYICSGYGNYSLEQYQDKEIEEILNPDEANTNVYVLSSGRWSVNQESPRTRKPTIDQEFEQYFSMLML